MCSKRQEDQEGSKRQENPLHGEAGGAWVGERGSEEAKVKEEEEFEDQGQGEGGGGGRSRRRRRREEEEEEELGGRHLMWW